MGLELTTHEIQLHDPPPEPTRYPDATFTFFASLPAGRPAYQPASLPVGLPAGLPVGLPACLPPCLYVQLKHEVCDVGAVAIWFFLYPDHRPKDDLCHRLVFSINHLFDGYR